MKIRIKSFVLGFAICLLIIGGTVFAAIMSAKDISFIPKDKGWKVDNVADALDDLIKGRSNFSGTYGVRRRLDSTSSKWERLELSDGKVANAQVGTTAVQNDFDDIYPWSEIKSYNYDADNHQITAWFGDADFTFTPTGNTEVLTYIPEFYYLRFQTKDYEYIYLSKEERSEFTKSEAFSIGRYLGSLSSSKLHSKSKTTPQNWTNIDSFRSYAKALGSSEFSQLDYHYFIIQLLYLVEYADYDARDNLGPGYTVTGASSPIKTGGCDELGMHSGSADGTSSSSVIYRGIEDVYGNAWQFVDGINITNNQAYVCYNPANYASNTFSGCYKRIGYLNSNIAGFITELGYDVKNPLISLPIASVSSSDDLVIGKYLQGSGNKVVLIGGQYGDDKSNLWYWHLNPVSSETFTSAGARLIKYA